MNASAHPCTLTLLLASFGHRLRLAFVVAVVTASLAPAQALAAPAARATEVAPAARHTAPFDHYYGLYVAGQKAGWMRTWLVTQGPEAPMLAFHLEAKVAGMGQKAQVVLDETRRFSPTTGLLAAIHFRQQAQTGAVEVNGRRQGQRFALTVEAGGSRHQQMLDVDEKLGDDLALVTLARQISAGRSRKGASARARHLDPATQTMVEAEMVVQKVDAVMVSGIKERDLCVVTRYPALKVEEVSHVDGQGRMLRTRVGGLFEARLEPEMVAKKPGTVQDVLLGAVVKVPKPLAGAAEADVLQLTLAGLQGESDVPPSPRLRRRQTPTGLEVTLRRDRAPAAAPFCPPWKRPACPKMALPPAAAQSLLPSAYVQSAAPEIVAMARKATAGATDGMAAVTALAAAVKDHLRPEYVPAFSNALEAYRSRRGDCTEHAVLFVALCRAAGIPARSVVGVAFWPPGGGFGWHAWGEVFVGGQWLQVDPTWGQPIADVTHLKLAEGGPAEQASVVMLLGRLQVVDWQVPKL